MRRDLLCSVVLGTDFSVVGPESPCLRPGHADVGEIVVLDILELGHVLDAQDVLETVVVMLELGLFQELEESHGTFLTRTHLGVFSENRSFLIIFFLRCYDIIFSAFSDAVLTGA